MKSRFAAVFFLLFTTISFSHGQVISEEEREGYKKQSEELISFLEYIFNALGSHDLSVSEKDVIINQSYLKAFEDKEVQIEDDLIPNREVTTNKDVQAYLKDIDFFFKKVNFDFNIEDISEGINEEGEIFYKVKMNRIMQGIDVNGDSINNSITRFVELNLEKEEKDLKIASIYTTKLGEKEELIRWWISLSPFWKNQIGQQVKITSQLTLNNFSILNDSTFMLRGEAVDAGVYNIIDALRKAIQLESIDVSNNRDVVNIDPLYEMNNLKYLNISNTGVYTLFPLRNLTTLETLNCSYTLVDDLEALKYCLGIKKLDISNTNIRSVNTISNFPRLQELQANNIQLDSVEMLSGNKNLQSLSLSSNNLHDISFLSGFEKLTYLDLSNNDIHNLSVISKLSSLKTLNLSGTPIKDLEPLSSLKNLEILSVLDTEISNLTPLLDTSIKKIYCEGSNVDRSEVSSFLSHKSNVEIIFQTDILEVWWKNMPLTWKDLVFTNSDVSVSPTPEELHQLIKIDSINVSGHKEILNLDPLSELIQLKYLNCANTSVKDLGPLYGLSSLEKLNISGTGVTNIIALSECENLVHLNGSNTQIADLSSLEGFQDLKELNFENSNVSDLKVVNSMPSFSIGYFDNTPINDEDISELNYDGEDAVVLYKSEYLREWWGKLTDDWQDMFRKALGFDKVPDRVQVHRLVGLKKFVVKSILINDISVMQEFVRLRELKFNDTQISNISPLAKMKGLEVLDCSRNPIESLEPLANLINLRILYAENTQIDEIDPLENLVKLEELKISNTEVKDLDPLENKHELRILEIPNTRVRNLKPIYDLEKIEVLRCYNTNLSDKRVDEFKARHPNCEVIYY